MGETSDLDRYAVSLSNKCLLDTPGPEVINFFMLNSTEHKISTAHKN